MIKKTKVIFYCLLIICSGFIISIFVFPLFYIPFIVPKVEQVQNIQATIKNDTAFIKIKIITKRNFFFSVNVDTVKYKVTFFNKIYFQEKDYIGVKSHPGENDTIHVSIKVPYKSILDDIKNEKRKKDSTDFTLNLSIHYTTFLGSAELPVKKASRLKIPDPPEIALMSIKYKKFNFKSIIAEAKVKVSNHSDFGMEISDMSYRMNIEKFALVKGARQDTFKINAGADSYIIFPIDIKIKKLETSILDALRADKKYHYVLDVNALISSPEFKQEKPTYMILKKEDETELLE